MKLISPNFIGVYDNALSSYKCMEIIKFIESQKLVKGLFGGNKIDLEKKDDWEVGLDLGNISNGFFVSQYISSCLSEYTPQYRHRYPEIDSQSSFSAHVISPLFIHFSIYSSSPSSIRKHFSGRGNFLYAATRQNLGLVSLA